MKKPIKVSTKKNSVSLTFLRIINFIHYKILKDKDPAKYDLIVNPFNRTIYTLKMEYVISNWESTNYTKPIPTVLFSHEFYHFHKQIDVMGTAKFILTYFWQWCKGKFDYDKIELEIDAYANDQEKENMDLLAAALESGEIILPER